MQPRGAKRVIKRLEIKFYAGGASYTGITSNLSESGLFIRTFRGVVPGSILDMELMLPDGNVLKLSGKVIRTVKTQFRSEKNGMGIKLIGHPDQYLEFLKTFQ
ncbi:MAG: PilZ domain-containing protein [Nitrospirae bacterium]|nr:PilZ domain-containing protein [Nitrospirota bacterium]